MFQRNLQFSILFHFILTACLLLGASSLKAQKIAGQEFWFTLPPLAPTAPGEGLQLYVVSDFCIEDAFVEIPGLDFRQEFTVDRGQFTQITIPTNINGLPVWHNRPGRIEDKAIHLKADFPVLLYVATYEALSVDGEIILPVSMLGEEYVIANRGTTVQPPLRNTVVATEDNTDIEVKTWDNAGNPIIYNETLNRGQTYQWGLTRANCNDDQPDGDNWYAGCITANGSVVSASKPVAVIGSLDCSGGFECGACDNTMITNLPLESWGTEFVTAQITERFNPNLGNCLPGRPVSGDFIDVVGPVGANVTITDRTGTRTVTLEAPPYDNGANYGYGYHFFDVAPETGLGAQDFGFANTVITSDQPIQITQHPKGWQTDNVQSNDPENIAVYPTNMWKTSYIFAILRTVTTASAEFTIVVENVGDPAPIDNFEFDNGVAGIRNVNNIAGASPWIQIGNTDYFFKRVPANLSINTLRIYSRTGQPFGIYTLANGNAESYIQNGGDGPIIEVPACPICPIAEFEISPEEECIGNPITFTDLSEDNDPDGDTKIVDWTWDYGDGTSETFTTSTNPTHVYDSAGTFDVTLTVTNDNPNPGPCPISITKKLTILPGPDANAGPDQEICFGENVVLGGTPTGTGGNGNLTYSWTPNNNLSSNTNPNPTAQPANTEIYTVQVEDEEGCKQTDDVEIVVIPKDSAYIADDEYTVCNGNDVIVNVTITGGNADSYDITLSNGNITVREANFPGSGTITVPFNTARPTGFNVSISNFSPNDANVCGAFDIAPIPVNVRPDLGAEFENASVNVCEGEEAVFEVNIDGPGLPVSFDLVKASNDSLVESITGTTSNPHVVTIAIPQSTILRLTNLRYADDPTCPSDATDQVEIVVQENPNPGEDGMTSICAGSDPVDLITVLEGSPDAGGTWRDLNLSGALVNGQFDPSTGVTDGEYRFEYTISSNPNCEQLTAIATVDFNEPPKVENLQEECSEQLEDYKVTFTATGGDPSTFSSPDGTFSGRNFTSTADYATKTSYNITFDDANGCGPVEIQGVKNCGCFTNAGTMLLQLTEVCETDIASPTFNNDSTLVQRTDTPSDTLYFVLHEGNARTIVNPIDSFATPDVPFIPGLTYGKTYFLSPVAGEPLPSGSIDYDPLGCVSVGQGAPIRFYAEPTVNTSTPNPDPCFNEDAVVDLNITGAAPFAVSGSDNAGVRFKNNGLSATDALNFTLSNDDEIRIDSVFDKYCSVRVDPNETVSFTVRQSPDTVPGTISYECTRDAEFYVVTFELSGDAATMEVSPSTAGSIDPTTGVFTSNPIANKSGYSFTFSDQYDCGDLVIADEFECPCLTDAGTLQESEVFVCEYETAEFTQTPQSSFFDANDDSLLIVYNDPNDPIGSLLLEEPITDPNGPITLDIRAPLQPDVLYYASMAMGNRDGSGGIDFNDPCLSITPAVELRFNGTPNFVYAGDDDFEYNQCAGTDFVIPYEGSGNGPFSIFYTENSGPELSMEDLEITNDSIFFTVAPTDDVDLVFTRIVDANGCELTLTEQLDLNTFQAPELNIVNTNDTTICAGERVEIILDVDAPGSWGVDLFDDITGNQVGRTQSSDARKTVFVRTDEDDPSELLIVGRNLKNGIPPQCEGPSFGSKRVFITPNPSVTVTPQNQSVCEDGVMLADVTVTGGIAPFTLNITGPNGFDSTYSNLSRNDVIALPTKNPGVQTYNAVSISDASPNQACTGTGNNDITYEVTPLPTARLLSASEVCTGEPIPVRVNISGTATNYSLVIINQTINESNEYTNLLAGDTTLLLPPATSNTSQEFTLGDVVDDRGCSNAGNTARVTSTQFDRPGIGFSFNGTDDACTPLLLRVTPNVSTPPNSTCVWTFEDGQAVTNNCNTPFDLPFDVPGAYDMRVSATTEQGCASDTIVEDAVNVRPIPAVDFMYDPVEPTNVLNIVSFDNRSVDADIFAWDFGGLDSSSNRNPVFEFPTTPDITYPIQLIATSQFGCVDSITKPLTIAADLTFYIPNSFTPNADGVNDVFKPTATINKEDLSSYELFVYNRWGERVFYTDDLNVGWDGKYRGKVVRSGGYTYRLKAVLRFTGQELEEHGIVLVTD